jgi:hypothetical protein
VTRFWDAYYRYELQERPDGQWAPTSSRAAAEEDLYQDWSTHWRAPSMPTVAVRAMKPLNGAALISDKAVAAMHEANPAIGVAEAPDSNHFTCIVDPVTLAAMAAML